MNNSVKGFQLVAVNQIVFCSKPGVAGTYPGDLGTPPKLRKILAGTKFIVNTKKEYDNLINEGSAVPDILSEQVEPIMITAPQEEPKNSGRGPGRPPNTPNKNKNKDTPSENGAVVGKDMS